MKYQINRHTHKKKTSYQRKAYYCQFYSMTQKSFTVTDPLSSLWMSTIIMWWCNQIALIDIADYWYLIETQQMYISPPRTWRIKTYQFLSNHLTSKYNFDFRVLHDLVYNKLHKFWKFYTFFSHFIRDLTSHVCVPNQSIQN